MGIEKIRLLACEVVYWPNMNNNIKNTVKQCVTCLDYQNTQPQEKPILHELQTKPWEMVGADICLIKNETLLCIIDYYRKFPVMKRGDGLSTEDLIRTTTLMFPIFGLPKNGIRCRHNFVSDHFKQFCSS